MIEKHHPNFKRLSDEELEASRRSMFEGGEPSEDVWLFGYGSLIWNPTIEFEESKPVTVRGYHRRFCLRTEMGRGSPDCPGLVLGLDLGGVCRGLAFRIARDKVEHELDIVWRREMISKAYQPRWLCATSDSGPLKVIGFVMNRRDQRYAGKLSDAEAADSIARAEGFLGPCRDYLYNTVDHLNELGIPDAGLSRLVDRVNEVRARLEVSKEP